jgi:hypothetical protein
MLFLIVVISYSLKYIYLRVYLLMLDLVALHSFVAVCVFCALFTQLVCVDVDVVLLHACYIRRSQVQIFPRCWAGYVGALLVCVVIEN